MTTPQNLAEVLSGLFEETFGFEIARASDPRVRERLADLKCQYITFWTLSHTGQDSGAQRELRHIKGTLQLLFAREKSASKNRIMGFLEGALTLGVRVLMGVA